MQTIQVKNCTKCPFYYEDYCNCSLQQQLNTKDEKKLFESCPLKQTAICVELT